MDPFAGSGVIGEACLEAGAESVWLNDIRGTQRSRDHSPRWTHDNILRLAVPPGSVDAIVTDPPWGDFSPCRAGSKGCIRTLAVPQQSGCGRVEPSSP